MTRAMPVVELDEPLLPIKTRTTACIEREARSVRSCAVLIVADADVVAHLLASASLDGK